MTSISAITLEVPDPAVAQAFYAAAFELGDRLNFASAVTPTTGFRGFTLSLVVSQPSTVTHFYERALGSGATPLKPAGKAMWGYGGVLLAPDGSVWKVTTSSKKDSDPDTHRIDETVLLLGVADVAASKRFYVDHGLSVAKSYFNKYVQFDAAPSDGFTLGLYRHAALAKDAGVPSMGSGSHRMLIRSDTGSFIDPDGFVWECSAQ